MRRRMSFAVVAVVGMVAATVPLVGGIAGATSGTLTITTDTTLTEDHVGGIVIAAHDVTLDCAGFVVSGDASGSVVGVLIDGWIVVTVMVCSIT